MHLIDELRHEHDLIDVAAGSFRTYAVGRDGQSIDPGDGRRFVRFFRLFAGEYHHAREEHTLFAALVQRASLPGDRGPIAVLTEDHHRMAALLTQIDRLLEHGLQTPDDRDALGRAVTEYADALAHHIDAENSVLLPESEARLASQGVGELPSRPPTDDEAAAGQDAEDLVRRYPPARGESIRGDGCVLCPAMGQACAGLEAEWWNDWEWEEFSDHLPSG